MSLNLSFSFLPAEGLHNIFSMAYKFVLSSAITCQQHLSELNQMSNNATNSSKLDSCLKAISLTLLEQRKWPPDIHNSRLSQDRKEPWKTERSLVLLFDSFCFRVIITVKGNTLPVIPVILPSFHFFFKPLPEKKM